MNTTDYTDPADSPIVQDIIMGHIIGITANLLTERLQIVKETALDLIYTSEACTHLHEKKTGLYLQSPAYFADEIILELQAKQNG